MEGPLPRPLRVFRASLVFLFLLALAGADLAGPAFAGSRTADLESLLGEPASPGTSEKVPAGVESEKSNGPEKAATTVRPPVIESWQLVAVPQDEPSPLQADHSQPASGVAVRVTWEPVGLVSGG